MTSSKNRTHLALRYFWCATFLSRKKTKKLRRPINTTASRGRALEGRSYSKKFGVFCGAGTRSLTSGTGCLPFRYSVESLAEAVNGVALVSAIRCA